MSLETLLRDLPDLSVDLAVADLVHLSNMSAGAAAQFAAAWPELDLRRRRWLVEELAALAEDNVELSFDAVYFGALADRDPDVRRLAIRGLWEYETRDFIEKLTDLLAADPDPGVRSEAALALGRFALQAEMDVLRPIDAERVDAALARAFRDEAEVVEVRARALESLGSRSEDWVHDLIQDAYDAADRHLRISAVHAMGRSAEAGWLPALFEELGSDDAEMRFEAATAAGQIGDEEAASHLLEHLQDEDVEVQDAVIAALGQVGGGLAREALMEIAKENDERRRDAAQAALAEAEFVEDPLGFALLEE